jgi:MscS family membrane protein
MIATIGWFLIRFAKHVENNVVEHRKRNGKEVDSTTIEAVGKLARVSIIITTTLVGLHTVGVNIAGVLAFGGIGGIAVGFAAKDLLANFFGAMMIYFDRPFVVGDWVRSPDKSIEGTVESIGWRLTRIRTFDKRPLYVPNSVFTSIAVENPSRMTNRRIYETIGVRYDDVHKVELIINNVKEMLQQHEEIDQSQTLIVNFNKFASSSLDFFVYTFTKTTNWIKFHEVKQDVLLKIIKIVEEAGAEMAFPTSTVHVPDPIQLIHSPESHGSHVQ